MKLYKLSGKNYPVKIHKNFIYCYLLYVFITQPSGKNSK